jgi:CubicO group peptidase (beta-lactamase class C family)
LVSNTNQSKLTGILTALLNNGTDPLTHTTILRPETVDLMFTNQIPQFPNFSREAVFEAATPAYSHSIGELYPIPGVKAQHGWGLSMFLGGEQGPTGRAKGAGWWAGLPSCFWWCDRARGVAGFIAAQVLPFPDPEVYGLWDKLEGMVYESLAAGTNGAKH